jgi:2-C-methyl-D-erythritol 4-phosphate cytidylyltransferase/2-C-methyl-D-erythritol 4-phosphate cytidylyltransferase/2-C-methyl-D-erythritol 2,4-cyclodiphosphate synthase
MTSIERGESGPRCFALVPCAGIGARAGAAGPKQYAPLAGRPLVAWTLEALAQVEALAATLVVLAPDDTQFGELGLREAAALAIGDAGADAPEHRLHVARAGGATRADSVLGGLDALLGLGARPEDWVLVHDAARCLVPPAAVRRLIEACRDDPVGGLLALPVADTLKRSTAEGEGHERVEVTVPRTAIWAAQTPQMFRIGPLREALRAGLARADLAITDEASAIEAQGLQPRLVRGDDDNFKVTWPEDFARAERALRGRAG